MTTPDQEAWIAGYLACCGRSDRSDAEHAYTEHFPDAVAHRPEEPGNAAPWSAPETYEDWR